MNDKQRSDKMKYSREKRSGWFSVTTITVFFWIVASILLVQVFSCSKTETIPVKSFNKSFDGTPAHVIIVFMENHSLDDIIGNPHAPYINSLADSGTLFTDFHGITHPSQGNYIGLFSGSTQGVTSDSCVAVKFTSQNLYTKFLKAGKTCIWYSEDLPYDGSAECKSGLYVRKHNPASDFKNVPYSSNKMFTEFPTDYNTLPNLVMISPNIHNDMHSGSIKQGDDWIKNNLKPLADYCKTNNSIFIITYDEDNHTVNHIPVIAYGEHVISNNVVSTYYDHYNMTRTICALFGAGAAWTDSLRNRRVIKGWLN